LNATKRSKQEARLASRDSTLAGLIDEYGPCPLITESGDPVYTLFTAIIAQQLSAKVARVVARPAARYDGGRASRLRFVAK
jgi:3-methyladenine DNA glycosylase/8-oxoguanine DNA glycosylase